MLNLMDDKKMKGAKNGFWLIVLFLLIVFFLLKIYPEATLLKTKEETRPTRLTAILLPTDDAIEAISDSATQPVVPEPLVVNLSQRFADKVSLYQVGRHSTFIGPKGWRGRAQIAVDGEYFCLPFSGSKSR
jgi:hypothetical protein